MDGFRPKLSLGKHRSEHDILDSALEPSFEHTTFHQTPVTLQKSHIEVWHSIRGALAGNTVLAPAVAHVVASAQVDAPSVLQGSRQSTIVPSPIFSHHQHLSRTYW